MSDHRAVWTTADEAEFLRDLAAAGKTDALEGYMRAARTYPRDWGGMDPIVLLYYARTVHMQAVMRLPIAPVPEVAYV